LAFQQSGSIKYLQGQKQFNSPAPQQNMAKINSDTWGKPQPAIAHSGRSRGIGFEVDFYDK
jgi:hypothetical protein